MYGCHAVSLVVASVFKGVLCDAFAGLLSDQLNALNDTIHNLENVEINIMGAKIPYTMKQIFRISLANLCATLRQIVKLMLIF